MVNYVMRKLIKRVAKKAAYQILMGRLIRKNQHEFGRFLKHDVDRFLNDTWQNVDKLIPEAQLEKLPTQGNRLNVSLAVLTIGAYHALLSADVEEDYAIELVADIGWKIYIVFLPLMKIITRCYSRNPQKQINLILRALEVYPFSIPGKPGYECKKWAETDCLCTYYTHCPPSEFVRQYIKKHGDKGELKTFQRSWCNYDWALMYAMVDGRFGVRGHYERPHTLSAGDDICDMRWYAEAPSIKDQG